MVIRLVAAAVVALVLVSRPLVAWNDKGHMAVAAVAYDLLSQPAQARVAELLKLNPSSSRWTKLVASAPAAQQAKLRFMYASLWPDDIKDLSNYFSEPVTDPRAGRNIGYSDRLQHRHWHYIDHPFTQDGTSLSQAALGKIHAEERIDLFRKVLGSNASDNVKSYDLVWLEHLIGDVHQPLHSATRVSKNMRRGDEGGNEHCLNQKCSRNLHSFWDGAVGFTSDAAAAGQFAHTLNLPDPVKSKNLATADWTAESFALAKSHVYVGPIKPGRGPSTVEGTDYLMNARHLSREQISLAGARLAAIINNELK